MEIVCAIVVLTGSVQVDPCKDVKLWLSRGGKVHYCTELQEKPGPRFLWNLIKSCNLSSRPPKTVRSFLPWSFHEVDLLSVKLVYCCWSKKAKPCDLDLELEFESFSQ